VSLSDKPTQRDQPTQAEVLRDRASLVPWRTAIMASFHERRGKGRTALPDRLEGAVLGGLAAGVGDTRGGGGADGGGAGGGTRMLDVLSALLDGHPDIHAEGAPPVARTADLVPFPLVLRALDDAALVEAAVASGGPDPVSAGLFLLILRGLLAGERNRGSVLASTTRSLRAATSRDVAEPMPDGFRSGWDAFARASGYRDAVDRARASGPDHGDAAQIAGALAGLYWGSGAIPVAWRRALPDATRARVLCDRLVETDAPGWDGRPWRTSTSNPLRVDPLDLGGLPDLARGSAGITFLPGRRYVGYHTGAHWRDLDTDAARLRELGVGALLVLVEDRELERCRVTGIAEALAAHGVELERFPIRDPLLPRDRAAFRRTVTGLIERVRSGASVAIACRGGLDRAGMTAGCLLREAGLGGSDAIERVQRARRGALTLPDQQAYVRAWPPGGEGPRRA